jgi:hypothetical protein
VRQEHREQRVRQERREQRVPQERREQRVPQERREQRELRGRQEQPERWESKDWLERPEPMETTLLATSSSVMVLRVPRGLRRPPRRSVSSRCGETAAAAVQLRSAETPVVEAAEVVT